MKKTYINPEMEIVKLETQQLIASSVPLNPDEVNGGLSREYDDIDDLLDLLGE
ncbi:MAG: hypothetical protein IJV44_02360 [Prevotella sp.]|nr:hypothetical protein [Prevotella sp.]